VLGCHFVHRKKKYYQRHGSAQIKNPDSTVYSTLNGGPEMMSKTLDGLQCSDFGVLCPEWCAEATLVSLMVSCRELSRVQLG